MTGLSTATREPECDGGCRLNERDVELLRHFAAGKSTAQTAAAMTITTNTVRTRVRRIQAKLAVAGRAEAIRVAQQIGIV